MEEINNERYTKKNNSLLSVVTNPYKTTLNNDIVVSTESNKPSTATVKILFENIVAGPGFGVSPAFLYSVNDLSSDAFINLESYDNITLENLNIGDIIYIKIRSGIMTDYLLDITSYDENYLLKLADSSNYEYNYAYKIIKTSDNINIIVEQNKSTSGGNN